MSIKNSLVALRLPRALEVLDATLRRMERGEIDGIEALDRLLIEELTLPENQVALTLAPADHDQITRRLLLCLPASLDRQRILAVAEANLH